MTGRIMSLVVAAMVAGVSASSGAQTPNPKCLTLVAGNAVNSKYVEDACQKTIDLFGYMLPQLGVSLTGGNATLGQGGTLGGFPRFTIGLRGNVLRGSLPQVEDTPISITGRRVDIYDTENQILGLPAVDAAIGIFKGVPLGLTNVGGVDLLVSAFYIPEVDEDDFEIRVPGGSLKFGFGARIGIIQESFTMPGVSFTYLRRDLPTIDLEATTAEDDQFLVEDFDVKTSAWRITASKRFLIFGLVLGTGRDTYEGGADVSATVAARPGGPDEPVTGGPISIVHKMTRTNHFADLAINFPVFRIIGEIGQVSGGTLNTYNVFRGKQPNASRIYGSAGIRIGF
jgi:hypothetical protein